MARKTTPSPIRVVGNVAYIELSKGKGHAIIDADDVPLVASFRWYWNVTHSNAQVRAYVNGKGVYLGRFLLEQHGNDMTGKQCDHRSRDTRDNRSANLRAVTQRVNLINRGKFKVNTSGFQGVALASASTPEKPVYQVMICHESRKKHIGTFRNKIEGAMAYDKEAIRLRGDDMPSHCLNFPENRALYLAQLSGSL